MKLRGVALEICQNKTKVGLKDQIGIPTKNKKKCQNKTKVGLKELH